MKLNICNCKRESMKNEKIVKSFLVRYKIGSLWNWSFNICCRIECNLILLELHLRDSDFVEQARIAHGFLHDSVSDISDLQHELGLESKDPPLWYIFYLVI